MIQLEDTKASLRQILQKHMEEFPGHPSSVTLGLLFIGGNLREGGDTLPVLLDTDMLRLREKVMPLFQCLTDEELDELVSGFMNETAHEAEAFGEVDFVE